MSRSIFGWSYPPGCSGPPDEPVYTDAYMLDLGISEIIYDEQATRIEFACGCQMTHWYSNKEWEISYVEDCHKELVGL